MPRALLWAHLQVWNRTSALLRGIGKKKSTGKRHLFSSFHFWLVLIKPSKWCSPNHLKTIQWTWIKPYQCQYVPIICIRLSKKSSKPITRWRKWLLASARLLPVPLALQVRIVRAAASKVTIVASSWVLALNTLQLLLNCWAILWVL